MSKSNFILDRKSLNLNQKVNEQVDLYRGTICLENKENCYELTHGEIFLNWNPIPSFELKGNCLDLDPFKYWVKGTEFDVKIYDQYFSKAKIMDNSNPIRATVCFPHLYQIQKVNEYIKKVTFSVVNFSIYNSFRHSELEFKFTLPKEKGKEKDVEVSISGRQDLTESIQNLKTKGGYCITHHIQLKFLNVGTVKEVQKVLRCLILSLRFLKGQDLGFIFINFLNNDNQIIQWNPGIGNIKLYKNCSEVVPAFEIYNSSGTSIIKRLLDFFTKTEYFNNYSDLIHWYNQANINSGYTSGSLILAQAGVELVWNLYTNRQEYKEANQDQKGEEKTGMKIGELMRHLSIPNEINNETPDLKEYSENYNKDYAKPYCKSEIDSLSHAIAELRNSLVHSNKNKRKVNIPKYAQFEARQILLLIIEKYLLDGIGFKGHYNKRPLKLEKVNWDNIIKFSK
ncbi:MAG: hypothetical protein OXC92_10575 [Flavobacteriaceae bacterium]|nr:hypothetical protein [Flavobacteriaceae bacterium]MCY4217413.1 hypothetical protein [Flavobacteriaceae bacterium]